MVSCFQPGAHVQSVCCLQLPVVWYQWEVEVYDCRKAFSFDILYSGKFSRVLIFAVFADRSVSAKIKPTNFLMCLYGCDLGIERPRKLNCENFPSDQSAKIGPLENFLLYGNY